jgi:hypothetical protein
MEREELGRGARQEAGHLGAQLSEGARTKRKHTPEKFLEKALVESARSLLAQYYSFVASELGVLLPEEAEWRYVDLVGAKWGEATLLDTAAVECKRSRTVRASINAALGQATDYQICFHKVFIATEEGKVPAEKRAVMELLGMGHIAVDTAKDKAAFSFQPAVVAPRFDLAAFEQLVAPRFVAALAFQETVRDIPGDLRYGGVRDGGMWLAKPLRGNLQWNCWWDEAKRGVYCGINIEHKKDVRVITERVQPKVLDDALGRLPSDYHIRVTMDPVPGRAGGQDRTVMSTEARRVDAGVLLAKLKEILPERKWRPHFSLYARAWTSYEKLKRWEYPPRLWRIRNGLSDAMTIFSGCYGES